MDQQETSTNQNPVEVPLSKEIETQVQKTPLGHILFENRVTVISIAAVALIVIIGALFYRSSLEKSQLALRDKLFDFTKGPLAEYQEAKITSEEFSTRFQKAVDEIALTNDFLPLLPEIYKLSAKDNGLNFHLPALQKLAKRSGNKELSFYISNLYIATIFENQQKYQEALSVLESLVSSPHKWEEKLYYDMGRINTLLNNKEKASAHFNHVVSKFGQTEYAKLAKVYLEGLK